MNSHDMNSQQGGLEELILILTLLSLIVCLLGGSLQKPLQPGALISLTSSLQRHPPTPARSQQTPIYQSISSLPRGVGTADTGIKLSASHNSSLVLLPRSGSSRAPSVCSSVILDTSEVPKNELAVKPPASAPPSILVKPDTLKNTSEKVIIGSVPPVIEL